MSALSPYFNDILCRHTHTRVYKIKQYKYKCQTEFLKLCSAKIQSFKKRCRFVSPIK